MTAHKSSLQNGGKGGVKEHLTICVHNSQTVACILLCFLYFTLFNLPLLVWNRGEFTLFCLLQPSFLSHQPLPYPNPLFFQLPAAYFLISPLRFIAAPPPLFNPPSYHGRPFFTAGKVKEDYNNGGCSWNSGEEPQCAILPPFSLRWRGGGSEGGFQYNWEAIAVRTVVFRPTAKKERNKESGEPPRVKKSPKC